MTSRFQCVLSKDSELLLFYLEIFGTQLLLSRRNTYVLSEAEEDNDIQEEEEEKEEEEEE